MDLGEAVDFLVHCLLRGPSWESFRRPYFPEALRDRPRHRSKELWLSDDLLAQMVDGMDGRARLGQKPDKFLGVVDDVVVGVRDKIRQAGTSLILWLETQGFVLGPFESVDWVRDFLVKSTYDVLADEYEVRNKYICAHLQSRLDIYRTGPPVPPILEGPSGSLDSHLLSGPAYRWFETRTREPTDRDDDSYRDRRLSILNSLTGLKKAQPEVSRTTVRKAVEKWVRLSLSLGPLKRSPRCRIGTSWRGLWWRSSAICARNCTGLTFPSPSPLRRLVLIPPVRRVEPSGRG
jgi:hypothetical protein